MANRISLCLEGAYGFPELSNLSIVLRAASWLGRMIARQLRFGSSGELNFPTRILVELNHLQLEIHEIVVVYRHLR